MPSLRAGSCAAVLLLAAFSALAQRPRPDFTRPQTYDVQHYTIRVGFDAGKKKVFGDTTVSLVPLKPGFVVIELDAVDLAFESVKLEPSGADLQFKTGSGKVLVTLDKTYGPNDLIAVRFKYAATPKKGVYFVAESRNNDGATRSAQIWTQGEAEEARYWFPSFDFPSDKATTEEYITAERGLTVIGNGELLETTANADGTDTWHYKMPVPHSTYLVSFVIGKYVKVEDSHNGIPLGFYVYPGREETARKAFGDTKEMIGVYERLTGIGFPYNKYDQTIVASFQFGGMENITATTMSDTEIFLAETNFGRDIVTDLVSHELAHSWFGDMVTCRNWAELWLNEGFATYMEAAYREAAFGRENYIQKVRGDAAEFMVDEVINKRRHALYNLRAGDVDSLFDNASTTYHKGGAVLHTLREQVGTDAFWKGINIYLNRHKFASVESSDLQRAMEEASGQDLGWFFDQWVYGAGMPHLDVRSTYRKLSKTLTLTIAQTQRPDGITPTVFRLPLDLYIKSPTGTGSEKLNITKRLQTFTIKNVAKPTRFDIDREDKVPLKKVTVRKMVTMN